MPSSAGSGGRGRRITLIGVLILSAIPATAAPRRAGPFTERQAERGQAIYNDHCAECHRPDLTGALGSSLVDAAFKRSWAGKPVSDLRDWIRANMPPNAPGTLPDDQLDPIVALILMKNGVTPGTIPFGKANADDLFPKP